MWYLLFTNSVLQKLPAKVFYKKAVLKNFAIFTGKILQDKCFPVNITKFLRTSTLRNIYEQLLLVLISESVALPEVSYLKVVFKNFAKFKVKLL